MDVIYQSCCGIDVHAKTAVVCLIRKGKKQRPGVRIDILTFVPTGLALRALPHPFLLSLKLSGSVLLQGKPRYKVARTTYCRSWSPVLKHSAG